jgi:hypothetical protein
MTETVQKTPLDEVHQLDDDFFNNIENFKPLRGGRRANTLNALAKRCTSTLSAKEAEKKFFRDYEEAKDSDDPLDQMLTFTSWFEEQFPSGKQKYFFPMLYKLCTEYSAMEDKYKDDERLMKLWFKLSENFPESGLAVMELAFHRGSCRQLARFYLRWSEMYQVIGILLILYVGINLLREINNE